MLSKRLEQVYIVEVLPPKFDVFPGTVNVSGVDYEASSSKMGEKPTGVRGCDQDEFVITYVDSDPVVSVNKTWKVMRKWRISSSSCDDVYREREQEIVVHGKLNGEMAPPMAMEETEEDKHEQREYENQVKKSGLFDQIKSAFG